MYTTCPECGTVFRVTVAVLRTARGQVRCGVCAATFDALLYLSEQVDAEDGDAAARDPATDTASHAALSEQGAADAHGDLDGDVGLDADADAHPAAAADPDLAADAVADRRAAAVTGAAPDTGTGLAARPHAREPLDANLDDFAFDDDTGIEEVEALRARAAREAAAPAERAFDLDLEFDESLTPDHVFPVETPLAPPTRAAAAALADRDTFPDDVPIEVAAELLVANADALPPPEFPPFEEATPAPPVVRPLERRAGRNSPSADEDRALAEIAAALARGAQGRNGPQAAAPDALDVEILDASVADTLLASEDGAPDDIPDAALEFDLPAEKWDQVFVADPETPTIPPLDAQLARAREAALALSPRTANGTPDMEDLDVEIEAIELGGDADDDDRELDDADDGDLDEEDAAAIERARAARARPAAAAVPGAHTDPLAQTDEFPPLRVTPEEEAAAGLAHTPAARRHDVAAAVHAATHAGARPAPGASGAPVPTPDFDALVAAAAARAAAEVAARVTPGLVAQQAGAQGAAPAMAGSMAAALAAPLTPAMAGAAGGTLARPASTMTSTPGEAPDWIQFDAKRFHDVARAGAGRAWWATALLALGIVTLSLGLGAQIVHYYRDTLAQHPVAGQPLRELYARLGLPLEPQWNLAGYELKQWGAATDAEPGTLRVRASVVNRAPRAQPYPQLRVTLEDRFGGRLARREFTPAEYLPGRAPPTQLLAPGARVDADLLIADPGSDAVGFELDVCLTRHGRIVCSTDLRHGGG